MDERQRNRRGNKTNKRVRRWDDFGKYASFKKVLRIMRLCKAIRQEVAELFYGKHQFQFSQTDGFTAMSVWLYNIQTPNHQHLTRITVRMPKFGTDGLCGTSGVERDRHIDFLADRGMGVPPGRSGGRRYKGLPLYGLYEENSILNGFCHIAKMKRLKRLEILIPGPCRLAPFERQRIMGLKSSLTDGWDAPSCPSAYLETLQPRDRIRHIVEDHEDDDSNYWEELHRLRCEKQSEDLIISLVLDFVKDISYEDFFSDQEAQESMRRARWMRAYAAVMGYQLAYTERDARGTYQVRNGSHPILEMAHNLLGQTEMLEPPVVPQSPVQGPAVSWSSYIRTREMCKEFAERLDTVERTRLMAGSRYFIFKGGVDGVRPAGNLGRLT